MEVKPYAHLAENVADNRHRITMMYNVLLDVLRTSLRYKRKRRCLFIRGSFIEYGWLEFDEEMLSKEIPVGFQPQDGNDIWWFNGWERGDRGDVVHDGNLIGRLLLHQLMLGVIQGKDLLRVYFRGYQQNYSWSTVTTNEGDSPSRLLSSTYNRG